MLVYLGDKIDRMVPTELFISCVMLVCVAHTHACAGESLGLTIVSLLASQCSLLSIDIVRTHVDYVLLLNVMFTPPAACLLQTT